MPHLTLPDGRTLDYSVDGAEDGFPFIWQHGTPGSVKATLPSLKNLCKDKGLKIISMSRAGYGDSSRHAGRAVIDNVADVKALLEHLGVEKCVAGGWSGGGPHVLALAAKLPAVKAALCVAGVAPADAPDLDFLAGQGQDNVDEFMAANAGEADLRKFLEPQRDALIQADAAGVVKEMSSILPEVDKQALLKNDELGQSIVDGFQEAMKNGVDGWCDDDLEFTKPWGFDFREIKVPVFLYQGSEDLMVPYGHGQWLAKHLPQENLRKHLIEGEGHISIFLGNVNTMMDELLEVVRAQ